MPLAVTMRGFSSPTPQNFVESIRFFFLANNALKSTSGLLLILQLAL
jgi:hypothetical protein